MRNNKFKVLSCMLAVVLATGSLMAGCGKSSDAVTDSGTPQETTDSGEQGAQSTPAAQAGGETTITVNTQSSVGAQEAWQAVADAYMEKNPNVKVVVDLKPSEGYAEWVQNIFTVDDPTADIVNVNLAGTATTGKVINFLEYADMDSPYSDGTWSEQFNFQMQTKERGQSEWSMLSLDSVQVVWCYNKEIFEEVGVEPPTTWDELVTVCEKLDAAGYQPMLQASGPEPSAGWPRSTRIRLPDPCWISTEHRKGITALIRKWTEFGNTIPPIRLMMTHGK